MIFNSFTFLCLFLPITLAGYFCLRRAPIAKGWLLAASFVFYSDLSWHNMPWLLASLVANYGLGILLLRTSVPPGLRRSWLIAGIVFNIGLLAVCKYTNFALGSWDVWTGAHIPQYTLPFPLGISFFTIQEISFLIDVYQNLIPRINPVDYGLFVIFFPRVSSGPILDYRETMHELGQPGLAEPNSRNIAAGLMLVFLGLGKKVLIADALSRWVTAGYNVASSLTLVEAWGVAFCYTFQIYFDFSGYSDMAVGLARMFNIRIPNNFNSPYHATSIIDFWNRWHITLTRWVTSYLYTPLVRSFEHLTLAKAMAATFLTMIILGLWHGAAWTYVAFGAVHGLALMVNRYSRHRHWRIPDLVGWILTFVTVTIGFVFYRAHDLIQASDMFEGMAGQRGMVLSIRFAAYLHKLIGPLPLQAGYWQYSQEGYTLAVLPLLLGFVLTRHNSQQEMESFQPNLLRLMALALLIFFGLLNLHQYAPFVYVNV